MTNLVKLHALHLLATAAALVAACTIVSAPAIAAQTSYEPAGIVANCKL
jgi:hypothetical protein